MSDFEIGLRKSIKKNFDNCLLEGCFFHYSKAIWKKIKKLKLFSNNLRYNTIILAFILKSYPFIKEDKRDKYCEKIENFCNNLGGRYIKLKNYFFKYWKSCELFNFTYVNNEIIENRTNNICECFHSKLNRKIAHFHPKMSFLVNELKEITKTYYNDYIDTLSNIKIKKESKNYIANDIFKFIKKFVDNNKVNFDLDNLIQYLNSDGENFYKLIVSIIDNIGDFNDNIIDNIKSVFINNNILKEDENSEFKNENQPNNEIIEDEEYEDEEEEEKDINDNIEKYNKDSIVDKNKDFIYLYNGDVYYEEKIKSKKIRKKNKLSKTNNILNDLDVII